MDGRNTYCDDLRLELTGVNEITDPWQIPFYVQWLTAGRLSLNEKAFDAINKITITDNVHLSVKYE